MLKLLGTFVGGFASVYGVMILLALLVIAAFGK